MKRIFVLVCLLALAATAFAADPNTALDAAKLDTQLQVNATAHTALYFKLQTSAQAKACPITGHAATPDYTMAFGNVDGLGLSANACTNNFAVAGGQMWTTNYAYIARFAGFASVATTKLEATLTAPNPTGFALYEGPQTAVGAGVGLNPLSNSSATAVGGVITSSTTPVDRTIGLLVQDGIAVPAAGLNYSATVTFTLTPQ
jgi:poly(3-hydroxybutyrate) depolymerase